MIDRNHRPTDFVSVETATAIEAHLPEQVRRAVRQAAAPTQRAISATEQQAARLLASPGGASPTPLVRLSSAAASGAVGGAVIGGGIAVVREGLLLARGQTDAATAARQIGGAMVTGSAQGAVVAAGGAVVRATALHAGCGALARGAAPVAIAATAIKAGSAVVDLIQGRIEGPECRRRCGQAAATGAAGWAGAEIGAAIGVVGGPPGMLAGAIIGGTLAALGIGSVFKRRN